MIQAFVPGIPQPQGSKNAYVRGQRAVIVEANKKLMPWRKSVSEALEAANVSCQPLEGALTLEVVFFLPQARTNKKPYPSQKPDLDKMIRGIGDAATQSGCIEDDAQIVEIVAHKLWASEELPQGALITISKFYGES